MKAEPSISVIIPARNEEGFVAAAVLSVVCQQTSGALECVVVDNGSTDGTRRRAEQVSTGRPIPVRVVDEPSTGVARAKNRGAKEVTGDILVFLDADSRMSPGLAAGVAEAYGKGFRAGSIRVVSDGGYWIDRAFFALMELGKRRFGIRAQMLYCERSLFARIGGFDPTLRLGEDVEFLKRTARALKREGSKPLTHISSAEILTSPRRLQEAHHLGMLRMFVRWLLAFLGFRRTGEY